MTRRREPIAIHPVILGQRINQRSATVIHTRKPATTTSALNLEPTRSIDASNVVPVKSTLDWTELAAIPEVYTTAWTALFGNGGLP